MLAAYDAQRTADCLSHLRKILTRNFSHPIPVVVVANSADALRVAIKVGWVHVINGSNAESEFSAYDEGIVVAQEWAFGGCIVLLNDRCLAYGSEDLEALSPAVAALVVMDNCVVGRVDRLLEALPFAKWVLRHYVRANFVMVSASLLQGPRPSRRLSTSEMQALVPLQWDGVDDWYAQASIDESYARFLTSFLTGSRGAGLNWYRAQPLTIEGWQPFREKVRSIVYEHALSADLTASGALLVEPDLARLMARLTRTSQVKQLTRLAELAESQRLLSSPTGLRIRSLLAPRWRINTDARTAPPVRK